MEEGGGKVDIEGRGRIERDGIYPASLLEGSLSGEETGVHIYLKINLVKYDTKRY